MTVYRVKLTFSEVTGPLRIVSHREHFVTADSMDDAIAHAKTFEVPEDFGPCVASESQVVVITTAAGTKPYSPSIPNYAEIKPLVWHEIQTHGGRMLSARGLFDHYRIRPSTGWADNARVEREKLKAWEDHCESVRLLFVDGPKTEAPAKTVAGNPDKARALDLIAKLEGTGKYVGDMGNHCYGDGYFAQSIISEFGRRATGKDYGEQEVSISTIRKWAKS